MLTAEWLRHDLEVILIDDIARPLGGQRARRNPVLLQDGRQLAGACNVLVCRRLEPADRCCVPVWPARARRAADKPGRCRSIIALARRSHGSPRCAGGCSGSSASTRLGPRPLSTRRRRRSVDGNQQSDNEGDREGKDDEPRAAEGDGVLVRGRRQPPQASSRAIGLAVPWRGHAIDPAHDRPSNAPPHCHPGRSRASVPWRSWPSPARPPSRRVHPPRSTRLHHGCTSHGLSRTDCPSTPSTS